MPVYEYECESCSCRFELKRGFSDKSAVSCPRCKSNAQQIFSPVPVIFKGTGFYVTDNRKETKGKLDSGRDGDKPADTKEKKEPPKEDKEKVAS